MKKRILIVDDNERNRKLITVILHQLGHEILEAKDGKQGVRLAREKHPELILLDIQLPLLNGVEAMEILKSGAQTDHIPIVALTSYAMAGDRENLLSKGFNEYISKPIDLQEFISVVNKYI